MGKITQVRTFVGKHSVAQVAVEKAEREANELLSELAPDAEIAVIQAQTIIHRGTGPESAGINDMFYHFISVSITQVR